MSIESQSLFYWIIYSYYVLFLVFHNMPICLNPYFIGLSILMKATVRSQKKQSKVSILILLDYLFLLGGKSYEQLWKKIVSILILLDYLFLSSASISNLPMFPTVSILILLDYLFLFFSPVLITGYSCLSQSLFYWIIYSYYFLQTLLLRPLNVSILILLDYLFLFNVISDSEGDRNMSQSLFYWIIYSYLMLSETKKSTSTVSILILLDYLFLY